MSSIVIPKEVTFRYNPHGAQKMIHESKARFKIVDAGRRFGKSTLSGAEAVFNIFPPELGEIRIDASRRPTRGWVVAPTYLLTREIERMLIGHHGSFIPDEMIAELSKSERRYTLVTGDIIEFRSGDSENLVGAGLDWMICDEFALFKEEKWKRYLRPCLSDREGRAILISTPRGRNTFYDYWLKGQDPNQPEYESWQFESRVNPHFPDSEWDLAKQELPELLFKQEYMAQFLDDANAFIRNVDEAVAAYPDNPDESAGAPSIECPACGWVFREREVIGDEARCPMCHETFDRPMADDVTYSIGVDLGDRNDYTVITVVRSIPGKKHRVVHFDRFNQIGWTLQKERIKQTYRQFGGLINLDVTGVGAPIADDLITDGIPVRGVVFSSRSKGDLMRKLSLIYENKQIEIPNDTIMKEELKTFEARRKESGTYEYGAPEGKHDDHPCSQALAVMDLSLQPEMMA